MDGGFETREAFEKYVYTDIFSALDLLKIREKDTSLDSYIEKELGDTIPKEFRDSIRYVFFRQVATPNFEFRRFLHICSFFSQHTSLFFEYGDDKFTSNNEHKYHLGRLPAFQGFDKNRNPIVEKQTVVDFARFDGKPISEVQTLWDEPLIDLHHELFSKSTFAQKTELSFFDASQWLKQHGGTPDKYYKKFLVLFLKHGILFENFMLEDEQERKFAHEIILPALKEIFAETGHKPLIVSLEPTDVEGDLYWMCYEREVGEYIKNKLSKQ
jgi:hypothetical protein